MVLHRTCDGVGRRDFLRAGAAGAAGLTLASYLQMAQAGTRCVPGQSESGNLCESEWWPLASGYV